MTVSWKSNVKPCENKAKERCAMSSCSREEAAGGQSSREVTLSWHSGKDTARVLCVQIHLAKCQGGGAAVNRVEPSSLWAVQKKCTTMQQCTLINHWFNAPASKHSKWRGPKSNTPTMVHDQQVHAGTSWNGHGGSSSSILFIYLQWAEPSVLHSVTNWQAFIQLQTFWKRCNGYILHWEWRMGGSV